MAAFTEKNTLMGSAGGVSGSRGVASGGEVSGGNQNVMQYVEISTQANAENFGDLTAVASIGGSFSNGATDRGIYGVKYLSASDKTINYFTISTLSNAIDFGNLTVTRWYVAGCSNGTTDKGVFAGGDIGPPTYYTNVIDYITISSAGDAQDSGDLNAGIKTGNSAFSNGTGDRAIFGMGWTPSTYSDFIGYFTISSGGDTSDFGNLSVTRRSGQGVSNDTGGRGVFAGGNSSPSAVKVRSMDYITIASAGNALTFGDLVTANSFNAGNGCGSGSDQRGLFWGGNIASGYTDVIEHITIDTESGAAAFGDILAAAQGVSACSNA